MGKGALRVERWGSGFSLIEVLAAAAIFSVGLTGLSLLLMRAVQGTVEARDHSAAVMHADALAELILMNPAALGHYIDPEEAGADCMSPQVCSPAEWATGNLARWQAELTQSLTGATGLVCRDATPLDGSRQSPDCDGLGGAVVKVFWHEIGSAAGAGKPRRVARMIAP